jgi:predicted ATPase
MWPDARSPQWVGRAQELAVLQDAVEGLRRGEGAAVWVEGEPGIGKSSLVAAYDQTRQPADFHDREGF